MASYIYGLFEMHNMEPIEIIDLPEENIAEAKLQFSVLCPEFMEDTEIRLMQVIE